MDIHVSNFSSLDKVPYCNPSSGIRLADAEQAHIQDIIELYRSVHINARNLESKLDPEHPDCYARTGGIFKALAREILEYMVLSDDYHVKVAVCSVTGMVVAYVSFHLKGGERYNESAVQRKFSELSAEEYAGFRESLANGKAVYGVDMITQPALRRKAICLWLQHMEYAELRNMGYAHVFYEIYTILEGQSDLVNPNRRLSVSKLSAKKAGSLYEKIQVGNRPVHVRSDVHVVDLHRIDRQWDTSC